MLDGSGGVLFAQAFDSYDNPYATRGRIARASCLPANRKTIMGRSFCERRRGLILKKRIFLFIVLSIGLLLVLPLVALFCIKHQEHLAARYHLLCEVLKPGMSESEVLRTLRQVGTFTINIG